MSGIVFELSPKKILKSAMKDDKGKAEKIKKKNKPVKAESSKKDKKKKSDKKSVSFDKVSAHDEKRQAREAEKARIKAAQLQESRENEIRQAETDIIRLIARRDMLRGCLVTLNPAKPKDAIRIANINIELRDIEVTIQSLRTRYNIQTNSIEQGSKFGRFMSSAKKKVSSIFGKVKKFFKKNKESIIGVACVAIPAICSVIASVIIKG